MRLFLLIMTFSTLFISAVSVKEVPSKLYYLNEKYVESRDSWVKEWQMYIALKTNSYDPYNFKATSKTYEIYYDKKFTQLAVKDDYIKDTKSEHYQRYDKQGTLRMEYFKKNGQDERQFRTWYSNGVLRHIINFNNEGQKLTDSAFSNTKELSTASIYQNGKLYKQFINGTNGKLLTEHYFSKTEDKIVFIINYDPITNEASLFYPNDSIYEDLDNPGTFISSYILIPVDSATIKKK